MITTLSEDQVKKHVELAAKLFLSDTVKQCNFFYTELYEFKFQSTNPIESNNLPLTPKTILCTDTDNWDFFLSYLRGIGVKGFTCCATPNELYFLAPIVSGVQSYDINKSAIELVKRTFTEPYFESCLVDHFDIPDESRLFFKCFHPQKFTTAKDFAHELGRCFDQLTYAESNKIAGVFRDLGVTEVHFTF